MQEVTNEVYRALLEQFRGQLFLPSDPQYETARRIWNGMVARRPGLIARCADVADVQAAVRTASAANVLTAVRCGGHSLAGFSTCDGGMVIDLSNMRQIAVEPHARKCRFAGGCLLGTVDDATQQEGLAFPSGVVSHTGASGLVLGGGFGWLTRLHGLSSDNVEGFTLVTADGSLIRANLKDNDDLFWALRGGGGNFGVVTEFEVRLHPVTSALMFEAVCTGDDISDLVRRWRDFMPESPDNLRWSLSLRLAPDTLNVPIELRGRPAVTQTAVWVGDQKEGEECLDHLLSLCNPIVLARKRVSFLTLQTMADQEFPHGRRYYTKSGYCKTLANNTIDTMVQSLANIPSPMTQIELAYLGGGAARGGAADTAFGDRSSPFVINLLGNWLEESEDDLNVSWVRSLFQSLRHSMTPGVYINFMSGDEDDRVIEAYRERWERLIKVKSHYDPDNFFRLNQNIPPQGK
jgi:hypothetical protein